MVHVLIISPSLGKGGMERQLSLFLKYFDRKRLRVTLAVLEPRIMYELPPDVEVVNLNRKFARDPFFYFRLFRLLRNPAFDVINSKISGINELVMLFCGILQKEHLIVEIQSSGNRLRKHHQRMAGLLKFFKKDWWVICNSRLAQRELQDILSEGTGVFYNGNGIETQKFLNDHSIKESRPYKIGYVGRIFELKNLEVLIRAVHELRKSGMDAELYIKGPVTDTHYLTRLQTVVEELQLMEQVSFISPEDGDVGDFYNSLDIFVLPSLHEGTPNVLLEAMSCECICLCSHGANTDQFLEDPFTFEAKSVEELAAKIKMAVNLNEEEKEAIGKRNRHFIVKNYSIQQMVDNLTDFLISKVNSTGKEQLQRK